MRDLRPPRRADVMPLLVAIAVMAVALFVFGIVPAVAPVAEPDADKRSAR